MTLCRRGPTIGVVVHTRQRVIEILRLGGGGTVEEIAERLDLTRTAITTHLAALQADGLVTRQGFRPGRRRPSVLYVLTPKADALFPKAYDTFAAAVLDEIKREGPGELRAVLRRVGDRWIARDMPKVEGLRGTARLERVREILAEQGFLPSLERRTGGGYELREHNCPVMQLALLHEEVCEMVHRWLEAITGTRMVRVRCMRQGDPFSAYTLARLPGRA